MKALERIVTNLVKSERLAARSRWLIFAALGVWIVTSALALVAIDPGLFSRAGAVGTGLVLAAFAVNSAARQSYQNHLLKGLIVVIRANLHGPDGRSLMLPLAVLETADTSTRDFDHNLEAVGRLLARLDLRSGQARVTEVAAAVLSTLQWGYGDLVLNRTLVCGEWSC